MAGRTAPLSTPWSQPARAASSRPALRPAFRRRWSGPERARAAGVIIVQASRAGSGRVAPRRYLRETQMVAADNLNPQKARILLMLALTRTREIGEIARMFDTY